MYERLGSVLDDNYLNLAFLWLCKQRKRWPDHADVWSFRRRWHLERQRLGDDLAARRFRFELQQRVASREGDPVDLWSARDAVVLKALSLALGRALAISPRCFHVKGHGGAKAAVREVLRHLPRARFVVRTDVRDYYASIDHVRLLDRLAASGLHHTLLNLVGQMCCRTSQRGGLFYDFRCGIPRGCPLSPLLGAFFLKELDERLEATGLFFVRYMDDIVVLAPTRHKLRRAVNIINETFASLGLERHPDKTFIGRVEKGFDFLGYRLTPQGLSVAPQTFARFIDRAHRLYEQERGKPEGFPRLGAYARRWRGWARGGLSAPTTP